MVFALFKRDMKSCLKVFLLLFAVMCMYTTVIIYMYDPELADILNDYQQALPGIMSAVGMMGAASSLLEWMQIYLYGFIMLLFPLIFIIIIVQKMVMSYIDRGSMANLLSSPNSRRQIIATQMCASIIWVTILMSAVTAVGIISSEIMFPGELDITGYLLLNGSILLLQMAVCGIAFLAAVLSAEVKTYYMFGAGIPVMFFLFQMLSNMGGKLEGLKYVTLYTLLPAAKIIQGEGGYWKENIVLLLLAAVLFLLAVRWFEHRDLSL